MVPRLSGPIPDTGRGGTDSGARAWAPLHYGSDLANTMYLYPLRGEVGRTREAAEATIACADEYGFPYWGSIATIHLGWALAMADAAEAGLERMDAGLAAYRRTGATLALPWFLGMFAEAQQAAGRCERAAETLDDALALVERTGERFYAAELHRLRGAFLGERGTRQRGGGRAEAGFVHRTRAAGPGLVAQGSDQPRPPVAGSGPRRGSAKAPRARLQPVHRRCGHRGSSGSKGAARSAGVNCSDRCSEQVFSTDIIAARGRPGPRLAAPGAARQLQAVGGRISRPAGERHGAARRRPPPW